LDEGKVNAKGIAGRYGSNRSRGLGADFKGDVSSQLGREYRPVEAVLALK